MARDDPTFLRALAVYAGIAAEPGAPDAFADVSEAERSFRARIAAMALSVGLLVALALDAVLTAPAVAYLVGGALFGALTTAGYAARRRLQRRVRAAHDGARATSATPQVDSRSGA